MTVVKLDEQVMSALAAKAVGLSDSPNKILRRMLGIDKKLTKPIKVR